MGHRVARWLAALACLTFILAGSPAVNAAKHKKSSSPWPSKKSSHKHHRKAPSSAPSSGGGSKAPADEADDDDESESADNDEGDKKSGDSGEADAPPFKSKKVAKAKDGDEDGDHDQSASSGDDEGEGSTVVHRKARKPVADDGASGAPVAVELAVGPRAIHRTFDFNEPLSDFQPGLQSPAAYNLPAGPAPFVDLALYPMAFAGGGALANIGVVGRYEKLIGTSSIANKGTAQESTTTTSGQQFEVGLRGRLPLGSSEVGLTGTFGQHSFHVAARDLGPTGSALPNVDYTFVGAGLDTRVRVGDITIGGHVGTRLVLDTGSLEKNWATRTTTQSIEGGLSIGYHLTPMFEVVGGGDLMRYAFNFHAKPGDAFVAGGAVDQYISGFLALRVLISGG